MYNPPRQGRRNMGGLGSLGNLGSSSLPASLVIPGVDTSVSLENATTQQLMTSAGSGLPVADLTSPTSTGLPASYSQQQAELISAANTGSGTVFDQSTGSLATVPTAGGVSNLLSNLFGSGTSGTSTGTTSGLSIGGMTLSPIVLIIGAGILLYLLTEKK